MFGRIGDRWQSGAVLGLFRRPNRHEDRPEPLDGGVAVAKKKSAAPKKAAKKVAKKGTKKVAKKAAKRSTKKKVAAAAPATPA